MSSALHSLEMLPVQGPVYGSIRPPGSKSITNRAFILAALAQGTTELSGVLDSQDTRVMAESLGRLGIPVFQNLAGKTAKIEGRGGAPVAPSADLWLENSGTSIRFLTALCTLGRGNYRLDGNDRCVNVRLVRWWKRCRSVAPGSVTK